MRLQNCQLVCREEKATSKFVGTSRRFRSRKGKDGSVFVIEAGTQPDLVGGFARSLGNNCVVSSRTEELRTFVLSVFLSIAISRHDFQSAYETKSFDNKHQRGQKWKK